MSKDDDTLLEESEDVVAGQSELLRDLAKGLAAGFIGTIPAALLLLLNPMLDLLPSVDPIALLGRVADWTGAGWMILFAGGTLIGIGFAALDSHVEHATDAAEIARGAIFGFLLSVLLMILFFGLNGGSLGGNLALLLAIAGVVYGAVMGAVYARLKPEAVVT